MAKEKKEARGYDPGTKKGGGLRQRLQQYPTCLGKAGPIQKVLTFSNFYRWQTRLRNLSRNRQTVTKRE